MTKWMLPILVWTAACNDTTNPEDVEEGELITTVELTFTPVGGTNDIVAIWSDPELDGDPEIDQLELESGVDYSLSIRFFDDASSPREDITLEIEDEAEEHQVFLTGDAVSGPATATDGPVALSHTYADEDANGLPVGLVHDVSAVDVLCGDLEVTLRHLPEEAGAAVKVAGLAETVATSGFSGIPGDTDVQVTFEVCTVALD